MRISAAGKAVPPKGWVCPRRTLSEHLLLYVRKGSGTLQTGEQTLPLRAGHLCLIRAGTPHLLGADSGQVLEHWYLHFVLLDAHGAALVPEALRLPEALVLPARRAMEREFLRCVQCAAEQGAISAAGTLASFFNVLEQVLQEGDGTAVGEGAASLQGRGTHARRSAQVMDAVELMLRHVSDDLSTEEIAAHVGMSASHFEKVFRRVTGTTPYAYYLGVKMERAKALMAASNRRLSDIAIELGFSSLHHFSRAFKQYEGELPSRYATRVRPPRPKGSGRAPQDANH
ncbi:MAG TPA: AraC family transcriptional regulator [Armatimonadetes bacterium]|nr:AraC family transcriptional regulator [Armatimonadota bacterium]